MIKNKIILCAFFSIIVATCCIASIALSGCSSQLELCDYKGVDFSFLNSFDYGSGAAGDVVCTFDTVKQLQESDDDKLTENSFVRVKGFYSAGDFGGASYVIKREKGASSVELKNGLFADLIADKCTIKKEDFYVLSVKQFGAKSDGVTADQNAINSAVSYINENLGGNKTVLYLPAGEYRVDNEINANDMKNVVFTGAGTDTVIFTDDNYKSWWEFFFACWRDENCFFGNFKIEARESWGQNRYFRQLTLIDCNNCYLYNLTLNVPDTAWTGETFDKVDAKGDVAEPDSFDKQYTNLTLYSGDKNITVDGCTMYQMSGTYRGANIGIMDFYERVTENITVKNCTLHDNARDEQVGIFTKSGAENSKIIGVNFLNNKVFTYPTPYKSLIGGRTMCFTVAYDNEINDINIEGNEFVSYTDSKFMSFGSAKNCIVRKNKITVYIIENAGYFFDSSCKEDGDVIIEDNDFYFTYAENPATWKCVSAGHLTFRNNRVIAACTVYKIADRLGIYEGNNFQMLGPFRTCGSAVRFNYNTVVSYGEHAIQNNELFFDHSGDSTFNENTVIEFIGNTVTDYTYFDGAKNQKVFDTLSVIRNVNIKELRITDNVYNCPNYRYSSAQNYSPYMWICWVRDSVIENFICENNDLQGADVAYGAESGENTLREFSTEVEEPDISEIGISGETLETDGDRIILNADAENIAWFVPGTGATVDNGEVVCKDGGTYTVYAAATDGSGVYSSVTVTFYVAAKNNNVALIIIIVIIAVLIAACTVVLTIILVRKRRR